jgi:hypothetical protein
LTADFLDFTDEMNNKGAGFLCFKKRSGRRIMGIMSKDDVTAQIEAAFADTPSPGEDFKDISATEWDEGIVDYFRGKSWRGHRAEDLRVNEAALSFFTDKAFRYWLPAFMLAELESQVEADVIAESIAFHLTESSSVEARLRQFAPDELQAIAGFLDECAHRYADGIYDKKFRLAEKKVRTWMQKT